jgi:serine protease
MYVLKAPRLLSRSEITVIQTTWLQLPGVALVEPDVIVQTNAVPNDPEYPNQWHYFSPTTPVNGKTYAGIDAPGAWDQGAHGMGAVAAVLDTGITPHPDLGVTQINGVVTDASQGSEVTIDNVALSNTLNAVSVPTAVVVP